MRLRFPPVCSACLLVVTLAGPAGADMVLWYNGDTINNGGGAANEEATDRGSVNVFDDFVVTDPQGWTIERVWSNDQVSFDGVTQASWSIRSGMSVGNGGTVIAGGIATATQTLTNHDNPFALHPEYTIEVSGLSVSLAPGTYWLSVSPLVGTDTGGVLKSYVSQTTGLNAVGTPPGNNANSLINSTFLPYDYASAFGHDYSMGVAGFVRAVPEPSSLGLLGLGAAGLACLSRRVARRAE